MRQKDKTRVYRRAVVMGLLVLGIILFAVLSMSGKGDTEAWAVVSIGLAVLLFAIFFMSRQLRSIREGFPLEDEFSNKVKLKAESGAFKFSIYWILALMWYNMIAGDTSAHVLDASDVMALAIIGMGTAFVALWFYYTKKGV